jgi:hypothetical protein
LELNAKVSDKPPDDGEAKFAIGVAALKNILNELNIIPE